jgi:hypothetical protein
MNSNTTTTLDPSTRLALANLVRQRDALYAERRELLLAS